MKNYKEDIQEQLNEVRSLIAEAEKRIQKIKTLPESRIDIRDRKGVYQYYWVSPGSSKRRYVKASDRNQVREVAQYNYYLKLNKKLKEIEKNLSAFLDKYEIDEINNVYTSMSEGRRKLVTPLVYPDEMYANEWKKVAYEPMEIKDDIEFITDSGIRVRSKSELIIANKLGQKGIPFRYEYPMYLKGYGNVRPDFLCLNIRTRTEYVWEHFGKMDDEGYASKNIYKIHSYGQNGFHQGKNMIMTFETSDHAIRSSLIDNIIEEYLL